MPERVDPHGVMNFRIEIDGVETAEFRNVTGLEGTIGVKTHQSGGRRYPRKSPTGKVTHPNLVCQNGFASLSLYNWWRNWAEGNTRERKTITVIQLDDNLEEAQRINLYECFPVRWRGPEFDATSEDGVSVEEIEIAYEYTKEA